MEAAHNHIPTDLAHLIGYLIMAITLIWVATFGLLQRNAIVEGFKGKDRIWQFLETVMIIWLILFPSMIISDVFIGFHASDKAWFFMEIVFTAAVAGKVGMKYSENRYNPSDKEDNKSEAL